MKKMYLTKKQSLFDEETKQFNEDKGILMKNPSLFDEQCLLQSLFDE